MENSELEVVIEDAIKSIITIASKTASVVNREVKTEIIKPQWPSRGEAIREKTIVIVIKEPI